MDIQLVERFEASVARLFVKPADVDGRLVHASIGLKTELGEIGTVVKAFWIYGRAVDQENVLEEVGDSLFYIQAFLANVGSGIQNVLPYQFPTRRPLDDVMSPLALAELIDDTFNACAAFTECADSGMVVDVIDNLERILFSLTGKTLDDAMLHNIEKLAKRYPEGYTDAAANARADKR